MLGTPLNRRVRRTVTVTVDAGLTLTVEEEPNDIGSWFPGGLDEPQADNGLLDGSPRAERSVFRVFTGPTAPSFGPCDRFEVYGDDRGPFELIAVPKPVSNGRTVVGYSAPCLPVSVLYPRSAEIRALGSEETITTVECAIYSARDSKGERGAYVDTFCELPPSAWEHVADLGNAQLVFGDGSRWTLSEATLGTELPFVSASIRKAG